MYGGQDLNSECKALSATAARQYWNSAECAWSTKCTQQSMESYGVRGPGSQERISSDADSAIWTTGTGRHSQTLRSPAHNEALGVLMLQSSMPGCAMHVSSVYPALKVPSEGQS